VRHRKLVSLPPANSGLFGWQVLLSAWAQEWDIAFHHPTGMTMVPGRLDWGWVWHPCVPRAPEGVELVYVRRSTRWLTYPSDPPADLRDGFRSYRRGILPKTVRVLGEKFHEDIDHYLNRLRVHQARMATIVIPEKVPGFLQQSVPEHE
jgi:hypothetical protein